MHTSPNIRAFCCGLAAILSSAASGASGFDHRLTYDNTGPWQSGYQDALIIGIAGSVAAGALFEGDDNRLGHTLWQSVDALTYTLVTTEALKLASTRESPAQTDDPHQFFKGHGNDSFPSLHVAAISAALTPIMLEYGKDQPWVYSLEGLVAYEMLGRLKIHEHWQSDVVVGALVGTAFGFYAQGKEKSLVLSYLPNGVAIGWKGQF